MALERHDAIIAGAVERHSVTLIKSKGEGDATMSVFRRASDAAAASLAVQEALAAESWPTGVAPRVRVAMHSGEAFERDGDYYGPTVNRAARLRGLAAGRQIVVSGTTADLIRDHLADGATLVHLGEHELRGLAPAERVYELCLAGRAVGVVQPSEVVSVPELPKTLVAPDRFVGRTTELARLGELWQAAVSGVKQCVFVAGEPGIGKTALLSMLAADVHASGGIVLYGRCDEDLAVPYGAFTEALRASSPEPLDSIVPPAPHPIRGSEPEDRLLVFEAVVRTLSATSRRAPVMLVLDDLQWADKSTLLLLSRLRSLGTHSFWDDAVSIVSSELVPRDRLHGYRQVTAGHAAHAVTRSGQVASLRCELGHADALGYRASVRREPARPRGV